MFTSPQSTKRFPPACRFFAQGQCRAGDECSFAHILPIKGPPINASHAVLFDDALHELDEPPPQELNAGDSHSIQSAIRDLEMDQLIKKFRPRFLRTSLGNEHAPTRGEVSLTLPQPVDGIYSLQLLLIIPSEYPDVQCSLHIQNATIHADTRRRIEEAFEVHEWHEVRHTTLVQQLDWLSTQFGHLYSQQKSS